MSSTIILISSFGEERLPLYLHLKNFESQPVTGDMHMVTASERNRRKLLFVAGFLAGILNLWFFFPQHHSSVCISQYD